MPKNAILSSMLDRLYAAMSKGPSLNCRPHASRQRIDMGMLSRLKDKDPSRAFVELLSERNAVSIAAKVPMPPEFKTRFGHAPAVSFDDVGDFELEPRAVGQEELDPVKREWLAQRSIVTKLRNLVDDART